MTVTPPFDDPLSSLPHNLEAEQSLLGALLHDNYAFESLGEFLKAEHFAYEVHGQLFQVIARLIERGQVADAITVRDYLRSQGALEEVGGIDYLVKISEALTTLRSVKDYALIVYDLYLRRNLIHLSSELSTQAKSIELDRDARALIENAEQQLFDLSTYGELDRGFVDFNDALRDAITTADRARKADGKIVGVPTRLEALDSALGGLHASDLLILAGRPSMGKTALATNIAFNAALHALKNKQAKSGVAFFSLEMSAVQLAGRILSSESGVVSDNIRRGQLSDEHFESFRNVQSTLAELPLYIDDTPALTISALRTRCRRLMRQQGLSLIVIDYLQLLTGSRARSENRVQELSEITRGLKALAKELNVPVLALSQLSRSVEQRDDKRPQLADLRESGSIEQDADVVMFVYRHAYYHERKKPADGSKNFNEADQKWQMVMEEIRNIAQVIIAKQRHGPIGSFNLYFDSALTKFGNLDEQDSKKASNILKAA